MPSLSPDTTQRGYTVDLSVFRTCPSEEYDAHEFIYLPSARRTGAFVIEQGLVRDGVYTEEGKEITTAAVGVGSLLGSLLFGSHSSNKFAQALTKVQVRVIRQDTFEHLLTTQPTFARQLIGLLEARVRQLEHHSVLTDTNKVQERIISFLLLLAQQHGYRYGDTIIIDNFLTHQTLASITNTSRQTVSTHLRQLQQKNLLHYSRQSIVLLPHFKKFWVNTPAL